MKEIKYPGEPIKFSLWNRIINFLFFRKIYAIPKPEDESLNEEERKIFDRLYKTLLDETILRIYPPFMPISKYKCKHCGKIQERNNIKKWIKSYCEETGKDTHMYKINQTIMKQKDINQRDKIMLELASDMWIGGDILNKISFQYHTRIWELENKHHIKLESRWKKNDKGECIFKEYKLIPTMESSEYINNLK